MNEKLSKKQDTKETLNSKESEELEERLAARLHKEWNPKGEEGSLLHMIEWGLAAPAQSVNTPFSTIYITIHIYIYIYIYNIKYFISIL